MFKKCYVCKTVKEINQFSKNAHNKDGHSARCRKCRSTQTKFRINTDPLYRAKRRLKTQLHSLVTGKTKTCRSVGCTHDELIKHLESKFTKGMSWDNYGVKGWHIDHIKPISGGKTIEEMYELNHYTNLQPLWEKDNLKKSNK